MCTGAEVAIPAIISALGAGTSAVAADQAAKKQDKDAAAGIMRQAELQKEASGEVNKRIQTIAQSNPDAERDTAQAGFMDAIKKARANGAPFSTVPGAASSRFSEESAAASDAQGAENTQLASNSARLLAPSLQRLHEGEGIADTTAQLGLLGSRSAGENFLTRLRIAGRRTNPWISALGTGLSAYGSASAGQLPAKVPTGYDVTPGGVPQPRP